MSTTNETPHKVKHRTGAGARFNADTIGLYRVVNIGVLVAALAAVLISWSGLNYVGQWVLLPPYMTWLVPVMIDVPIVVFTLATLARRSRGESVWLIAFAAYLLTGISALANWLHVAAESPMDTIQGIVGASIAALAPMLVLLTTEALGTLITKPPSENSPRHKLSRQAARIKELESEQRKLKRSLSTAETKLAERQEPVERVIPRETIEVVGARNLEVMRSATPTPPPVLPASVVSHFGERDPIEERSYLPVMSR